TGDRTCGPWAPTGNTPNTSACHRPPTPRHPCQVPTPGPHLAAQLAAGVDTQRPGDMLALGQRQQQVVGDPAGPRRAPGAAAGTRRGGQRLRTAGRAGGAEVVRGTRALREARALGRHGRRIIRVQQALGRGAPDGREAHGTDPHPVPGRTAPALYVPGSSQEGAWRSAPRLIPARGMEFTDRARLGPHGGQSRSRSRALTLHAGTTLAACRGVRRPTRLPGPSRAPARGASLEAAAAIVVEAEAEAVAVAAGVPEVPNREDSILQARRSRGANALPKARSLAEKAGATFPGRSGSCALLRLPACVRASETRLERVTECE
ncbi:hypothetical protein MC885_005141, partial [Smutsia gigantea]